MTLAEIEDETWRLQGMVRALGWPGAWCECSHVPGAFPWRFTFGGFNRRPVLVQGRDLPDAIAKARAWIDAGALEMRVEAARAGR